MLCARTIFSRLDWYKTMLTTDEGCTKILARSRKNGWRLGTVTLHDEAVESTEGNKPC